MRLCQGKIAHSRRRQSDCEGYLRASIKRVNLQFLRVPSFLRNCTLHPSQWTICTPHECSVIVK
jgi:hypothetical protein